MKKNLEFLRNHPSRGVPVARCSDAARCGNGDALHRRGESGGCCVAHMGVGGSVGPVTGLTGLTNYGEVAPSDGNSERRGN